jgi:transcriptional regulator with XRE-family HTH domain
MHGSWDKEQFRDLLDKILDRTGLTHQAIAALGGFSPSRISRWRSGENRPDYDTIRALVAGLLADYPEAASIAPALFEAAGYAAPVIRDPRPEVVRDNWEDENVRSLWRLNVVEDQKVSLVEEYLKGREAERAAR